jgi:Arc/MetJ-type ribon-helix-helix transcriptional regulator
MVGGLGLGTLVGTLRPMPNVCLVGRRRSRFSVRPRRAPQHRPALARCNAKHYNCSARLEALLDDQITVRLPTPLGRTLRRASRRLGRRPSDVVRMALEAFLQGAPPTDSKPAERAKHLIGSLTSGVPDLAERHREYVLAALKHAR